MGLRASDRDPVRPRGPKEYVKHSFLSHLPAAAPQSASSYGLCVCTYIYFHPAPNQMKTKEHHSPRSSSRHDDERDGRRRRSRSRSHERRRSRSPSYERRPRRSESPREWVVQLAVTSTARMFSQTSVYKKLESKILGTFFFCVCVEQTSLVIKGRSQTITSYNGTL